jgi:hypothetical protein
VKVFYGDSFDAFITSGSWLAPLAVIIVTIIFVRIHPEPADACCKCFEDGVAFAGVFIGVKLGQWRNPFESQMRNQALSGPAFLTIIKMSFTIFLGTSFPNGLLF